MRLPQPESQERDVCVTLINKLHDRIEEGRVIIYFGHAQGKGLLEGKGAVRGSMLSPLYTGGIEMSKMYA